MQIVKSTFQYNYDQVNKKCHLLANSLKIDETGELFSVFILPFLCVSELIIFIPKEKYFMTFLL